MPVWKVLELLDGPHSMLPEEIALPQFLLGAGGPGFTDLSSQCLAERSLYPCRPHRATPCTGWAPDRPRTGFSSDPRPAFREAPAPEAPRMPQGPATDWTCTTAAAHQLTVGVPGAAPRLPTLPLPGPPQRDEALRTWHRRPRSHKTP